MRASPRAGDQAGTQNIGDAARSNGATDARLGLEMLSEGQRYTAVIAVAMVIALLAFGTPDGSGRADVPGLLATSDAAEAGLLPSPATPAAPAAALAPPAPLPDALTPTTVSSPSFEDTATTAPPPATTTSTAPPTTTTSTAPPGPPITIPALPLP